MGRQLYFFLIKIHDKTFASPEINIKFTKTAP